MQDTEQFIQISTMDVQEFLGGPGEACGRFFLHVFCGGIYSTHSMDTYCLYLTIRSDVLLYVIDMHDMDTNFI